MMGPQVLVVFALLAALAPGVRACVGTNITSVAPLVGSKGTRVTITGCGLNDTKAVSLASFDPSAYDDNDGGALSVISVSPTQIVLQANDFVANKCGDVVAFKSDSIGTAPFVGAVAFNSSFEWCYASNCTFYGLSASNLTVVGLSSGTHCRAPSPSPSPFPPTRCRRREY